MRSTITHGFRVVSDEAAAVINEVLRGNLVTFDSRIRCSLTETVILRIHCVIGVIYCGLEFVFSKWIQGNSPIANPCYNTYHRGGSFSGSGCYNPRWRQFRQRSLMPLRRGYPGNEFGVSKISPPFFFLIINFVIVAGD